MSSNTSFKHPTRRRQIYTAINRECFLLKGNIEIFYILRFGYLIFCLVLIGEAARTKYLLYLHKLLDIRDNLNNNILYVIITLLIIVILLAFAFNYQGQHIDFVCQQSDVQEACRVAFEP